MSRVYFSSPSGEAELLGSERAWLDHVSRGPAASAWDITRHTSLDWMVDLVSMIVEPPAGANYLHVCMREAVAEHAANSAEYGRYDREPMGWQKARTSYDAFHRFRDTLASNLERPMMRDVILRVAGRELNVINVNGNTALVAGAAPVQLAAYLHNWCEVHCWVDGPDREWMASIIDAGLASGIYRRRLDDGRTHGWEDVLTLLRSRDDEPVVLSYSVGDGFPNRNIARVEPTGVTPPSNWDEYDTWPEERKLAWEGACEAADERWSEMSSEQQWDAAMAGLKQLRPWAQLSPAMFGKVGFGPMVTAYDLTAADRTQRVEAAFAAHREAAA